MTYEAIRQWCRTFGLDYARRLRHRRGRRTAPGIWTSCSSRSRARSSICGAAVDEDGDVLDILVQSRRNKRAAKRFFRKLLKRQGREPRRLTHGQAAQLLGRAPYRDAVRGPQYPAV